MSGGDNGQQGEVQDAANVRIVPAFGRFPVRFSKITSLSQVVCHVFLLLFTANFTLHCGCCGEWSSEQGVLGSERPVAWDVWRGRLLECAHARPGKSRLGFLS